MESRILSGIACYEDGSFKLPNSNRITYGESKGKDSYKLICPFGDKWYRCHILTYKAFHPDTFDSNLCIHHLDLNKRNNDIHNLVQMGLSQHSKLHAALRRHFNYEKH